MFSELSTVQSFLEEGVKVAANLPEVKLDEEAYSTQTMNWPQQTYYAWALYGAVSFSSALYWIQRYYFQNWFGDVTQYTSKLPTTYTMFGLAETINRVIMLIMWTLTAVVWLLTPTWEGFRFFFTIWARVLHYTDILRVLIITVIKTIGFFTDKKTDYVIDDGTLQDGGPVVMVSMQQQLSSTDWYMENFGLTVSFSLFGDLMGISKWARDEAMKKSHDVEAQKAKAITTGKTIKPFVEKPKSTETAKKEKTTTDKAVEKPKPVVKVPEKRITETANEISNDFNFDF